MAHFERDGLEKLDYIAVGTLRWSYSLNARLSLQLESEAIINDLVRPTSGNRVGLGDRVRTEGIRDRFIWRRTAIFDYSDRYC